MSFQLPKGVISVDEAKKLNDNFTRQKETPNSKLWNEDDNRSCWWSLEDLQNYIEYAKAECKTKGHDMNGIRIYLGAYGPDQDDNTTMFMVPTCSKSSLPDGNTRGGDDDDCNPQDPPNVPGAPPLNGGSGGNPPGAPYP